MSKDKSEHKPQPNPEAVATRESPAVVESASPIVAASVAPNPNQPKTPPLRDYTVSCTGYSAVTIKAGSKDSAKYQFMRANRICDTNAIEWSIVAQ